jgi:transposase
MARRLAHEKRQEVFGLIRKNPGMSAAAISRETGVSEMTIAKMKREGEGSAPEGAGGGEAPKPVNLRERVQSLEIELGLERLKSKWLRKYAKATGESEQLEAEIGYLLGRLEIFGDPAPLRLADEKDADDDEETEGEGEGATE